MKVKILLMVLCAFLLQGCSWIIRFLTVNTSDKPVTLELKLKYPEDFGSIFHYGDFYLYEGDGKKLNVEMQSEVRADTLENRSHMKIVVPAHSTLEIGRLFNDTYDRYNQYFINGHVFSLEELKVSQSGKEVKMSASTFDHYFKKGKYGDVYYFFK